MTAAEAPWRQLSPHNAGCYPDAIRQIIQRMWWGRGAHRSQSRRNVFFFATSAPMCLDITSLKGAMMERAPLEGASHLGAVERIGKTTSNFIRARVNSETSDATEFHDYGQF